MPLKLYFDLMSQPARAVYIFMKMNGINFVECPIAIRKGEHFSEEYTKVNPFQKIPAIDDNGFVLTETVAILKYLAKQNKVPDHWYPSDIKKQARIDEYMNWQHMNLRANGSQLFLARLLGNPPDPQKLKRFQDGLEKNLNQIEKVFLRDSPFINGAQDITIADLLVACELEQPLGANFDVLSNHPILKVYIERVRSRCQPHYDFAHQYIRKVREKIIQGKL